MAFDPSSVDVSSGQPAKGGFDPTTVSSDSDNSGFLHEIRSDIAGVGRGLAPYAAGAGVGFGFGGPAGAVAGAGLVGAAQLVTSIANAIVEPLGGHVATPQDATDVILDHLGPLSAPQADTVLGRVAEATAGGAGGAASEALAIGKFGAKTLEEGAARLGKTMPPSVAQVTAKDLSKGAGRQAVAGGASGAAAQAVAELGLPSWLQYPASLLAGTVAGTVPYRRPFVPKPTPGQKAAAAVTERMQQDLAAAPKGAAASVSELQRGRDLGAPLTVMDVPGKGGNVRGLAGSVYRAKGAAKALISNFFEDRDAGSGERLTQLIQRKLGGGPSARRTIDGLREQQKQASVPLYEKAFRGGSTAPLEQQFQKAYADAQTAGVRAQEQLVAAQKEHQQAIDKAIREATRRPITPDKLRPGAPQGPRAMDDQAVREARAKVEAAQKAVEDVRRIQDEILVNLQQARQDQALGVPGAVWNPRIAQLLRNPEMRKGIAAGMRIQRNLADAAGERFDPTEYAVQTDANGREVLDADGVPIVNKVPNMRLLDAAKRGLDSIIASEGRDPQTGRMNQLGRSVTLLRNSLLEQLDALNPDYKTARDTWSSYAASQDAVNLGRKFSTMHPEELADEVSRMSRNQRRFVQRGVADYLVEQIAKSPYSADEAKRVLNNAWREQQLYNVFDSEQDFRDLVDATAAERLMFETRNVVAHNSLTAERGAEDNAYLKQALEAGRLLRHGASSNWYGAATSIMNMYRYLKLRPNEELNRQIAKIMIDTEMTPEYRNGQWVIPGTPQPYRKWNLLPSLMGPASVVQPP